ncbi:hypothetical protein ACFLT1_05635 [Bacteroidota bacterium]
MVYKFRILSDEDKEFARELLISSEDSFLDFHHCLQEDLAYDPKQLASFFITNSAWEKQIQITLIDMMDEEDSNVITMDVARLSEYIKDLNQRLLYVYDFFSERSFFIELTETIPISGKRPDPKIVYSTGNPPIQIDLDLTNLGVPEDTFMDDDAGDGLYDDDDEFENLDFIDTDDLSDE